MNIETAACVICGRIHTRPVLQETDWLTDQVLDRMLSDNPGWTLDDGACPACVQKALLTILMERGEAAAHRTIQAVWPLDAEAAFGALPTPLRMRAHPTYTGKGVTIAFVDSGFYPHHDLVRPVNRIRAWVDAGSAQVEQVFFSPDEQVTWRGWDDHMPSQWHGTMTSTTAAGNGYRGHGLYRGIASDAELVLIQTIDADGAIPNENILRALLWLEENAAALNVRVVNLSLGGDPVERLADNPIDAAIARLVEMGIAVTVAAGNSGERRLNPPATAPMALTVGGVDDGNVFDRRGLSLWHSNYGVGVGGVIKPELVAPSIWVVAPVLPGTETEREAVELFSKRVYRDSPRAQAIAERKLVTPYYQHVDGTSFAAPIVASVIAAMIEANPALTPRAIYDILIDTAQRIPGVPVFRQGYGVVDAGAAVRAAAASADGV
jgi:serine protease AprX